MNFRQFLKHFHPIFDHKSVKIQGLKSFMFNKWHHHLSKPSNFLPNGESWATGFFFSRSNGSPGKA